VFIRDVSERNAALHKVQQLNATLESRVHERTRALEAEKQRAEQANQAKLDFLARVSHAFRTPLNAIIGFTQLTLRDSAHPLWPEHRNNLEQVQDSGLELLRLVDDVIDFSRGERHALNLQSAPCDVSSLLAGGLSSHAAAAESAGVRLILRADSAPQATVRADPGRLCQVLDNLLSNAIKFNRPGGSVELSARLDAGTVDIEIRDTGPGMLPDEIERLFQPFERLDADRRAIGGIGIGLALVKELVEAMHGQIRVDSTPGRGSVFILTLPRADLPIPTQT
jgi:signal transduction histidine kinase